MKTPRLAGAAATRDYFVVDGVPIVTCRSPGGNSRTLAYGPCGARTYDWMAGSKHAVPISEVEFWVCVCHVQIASQRLASTRHS